MNAEALDQLTIALDKPSQNMLAAAIVIMMFAIALSLRPEHFAFLRKDPLHFWGGLAAQIIALPAMTILLAAILQPAPSIALGMIVVAACPGGNVSNFMTYASRGDTAYSVSLTAGSSIIAAVWTPAAILLWSGLYPPTANLLDTIEFNRTAFVLQTTMLLAAPLGLGMMAAFFRPDIAEKVRQPLALFGAGILAVVIIRGTIEFWPVLIGAWAIIMIPVVLHNASAFALGAAAGRVLSASQAQRRSLTFEVGIQNAGLAIVLLLAQMQGLGGAAAIAAVWGVWHFFSGGAMVAFYRYLDRRKAGPLMSFDVKITGGMVYDGDGGDPIRANIGVKDGRIVEIGECSGAAAQTIDAEGAIVAPGFIDLHTHYDGQISWDEELKPSVNHGVTTILMGNCGVGFAPVKPQDHDRLIRLMEGVEDIPGTALHEGLSWNWESFPDYMNAVDAMPHTIDFGVMIGHDPVRVYAMGERASAFEEATDDDIANMRAVVREAMEAGAAGFSIGRTDIHRTADGDWTPSAEASEKELIALAGALADLDHGVLQIVNDFNLEREGDQFDEEFAIVESFVRAGGGKPASISLMQRDMAPNDWQRILGETERLNKEGVDFNVQVAPRAIGVFQGLQCTFHPMMAQPSYIAIKDKPLDERVAIMRDPEFKKKCLSEDPVKLAGEGSSVPPIADTMIAALELVANKFFRLGENPDYEQSADESLGAEARRDGVTAKEKLYDTLLEMDGRQLIYFPIYNYTEFNYDNVHKMLTHPKALPGLSDGGAHVGTICDASFPTYLLTHWCRDRAHGQIPLARAIQMLSADGADYLGLTDRGRLKVGLRADINVIDHVQMRLGTPHMVQDLPAGGQRLLQPVSGYRATFVAGEQVIDNDHITDARPGRLVRFG